MKKLLAIIIGLVSLFGAAPAGASDPQPTIDWDREFEPILIDNGLVVKSCEGDAPVVCVTTDDGINLGHVEHLSYPTTMTSVRELKAEVRGFLAAIADDRAQGCAADYTFRAGPVPVRTVADGKGVRYSFTGMNADGRVVERTVGYMAVRNGHLHVLTAAAYDDGGCLANEGEFSVADLQAFESSFGWLVANTPLRNLS